MRVSVTVGSPFGLKIASRFDGVGLAVRVLADRLWPRATDVGKVNSLLAATDFVSVFNDLLFAVGDETSFGEA